MTRRFFLRSSALTVMACSHPLKMFAQNENKTSAMAKAATKFLSVLTSDQLRTAKLAFDDGERVYWNYVPLTRKGVSYKQMTMEQRRVADELLQTGLSVKGFQTTKNIISLEPILRQIEQSSRRDPDLYYFTIFGDPAGSKPWGFRFEGHHISLNFTIAPGGTASTPMFFGANPAETESGLRSLSAQEDLARSLFTSLDPKLRSAALISANAPADIITSNADRVDPLEPAGVSARELSGNQLKLLMKLIQEYAENMPAEISQQRLKKLQSLAVDSIHFAWAGSQEKRNPHYYRIQTPAFLIEYDNTQNQANHIHSVWRDFHGDFGRDVLVDHYHEQHGK